MNSTHAKRQARRDDHDNARLFRYGVGVALLVFLGALLYFYAVDQRGEAPSTDATPPAAQTVPQTTPAPTAPAAETPPPRSTP
jgi:hypothetical protein